MTNIIEGSNYFDQRPIDYIVDLDLCVLSCNAEPRDLRLGILAPGTAAVHGVVLCL
jgi:hypothetical protein